MSEKFNFNSFVTEKKTTEEDISKMSKKELKEFREKQEVMRNVQKHADYEAQQEKIDAPFGKAFKTGAHDTNKKNYKRDNKLKRGDY